MQILAINPKYIWTTHAHYKIRHYRLSEAFIKRVIRYPVRTEESIVPGTVACMRPAQSKKYSEVWTIYKVMKSKQLKIITAWRYPGKSPVRDPIPQEILDEIRPIL